MQLSRQCYRLFHNLLRLPRAVPSGAEEAAEKVAERKKTIPQRLKPHSICGIYGTAEAVPFQSHEFFRSL
jgi:hypothetical protein